MNAYLNQIIQTFQHSHPQRALNRLVGDLDREIGDVYRPRSEDEEIRYLHEEYETELHECVYCDRLYEAERDLDGWFESQYCEECCWNLNGEGRD